MHLMIDLETLGLRVSAPIAQIGVCTFDLPGQGVIDTLHLHTTPIGNFEWKTIQYWLTREDAPRRLLASDENRISLMEALDRLEKFCVGKTFEGIWSHGASFDLPMIASAFVKCGFDNPWDHHLYRDTRTMFWLEPAEIKAEVKHNALHDAIAQALAVQQSYEALHRRYRRTKCFECETELMGPYCPVCNASTEKLLSGSEKQ